MENELYHHGILGMKWGDRNGPPYPLGYNDHSATQKRLNSKSGLSAYSDSKGRQSLKKYKKTGKTADLEQKKREYHDHVVLNQGRNLPEEKKSRKEQKSRLTKEERKKYTKIIIGTAAVIGVGAAIYFGYKHHAVTRMAKAAQANALTRDSAAKIMADTLDDTDQILQKGQIFHRMESVANRDYSKATRPLYVSYKDRDVASYMTMLKDWHGTGKRYDVTLEALKDIRIPSEAKARAMFEELWKSDPAYRKKLEKTLMDTYTQKFGVSTSEAKTLVQQSLRDDPFKQAMYSVVRGKEDTAIWIQKLKSHGYDAITDYFDQGVMAEQPLIFFDAGGVLQKTGEQFVTKEVKLKTLKSLMAKGVTTLPVKDFLGEQEIDTLVMMIEQGYF